MKASIDSKYKEVVECGQATLSLMNTACLNAYDKFLSDIICMVLKREWFTTDEAKDFSFVTHVSHPGRKWIAYKGTLIGEETFRIEYDNHTAKMIYDFIPCDNFDEQLKKKV